MLSPQAKTFLFNSPKKCQPNEAHHFLAKTCSSTAIRSNHSDKQQCQEVDQQTLNYSKLLKQKDLKLLNLSQKLKSIEKELTSYKSQHNTLIYDLTFYKSKTQEEFYRNVCMESEIELINTALKSFIIKIVNLLQGNDKSMQCFAKHLQSLKVDSTELDHLTISKKLISTMEFQITQLTKSFYLLKKQPEVQKDLIKSVELRYESYQIADQIEKDSLRKHIDQLIDYYETKIVNSDDYNQELLNLRKQRQYIKELLVSSEREKNEFANQIYEIARKEYQVDFERMNKSDVVKFCMGLLAKVKELEQDKSHLQEQIRIISTAEKEKYQSMLELVKRLQRGSEKKTSIKRLNSMPYY